MNLLLLLFTAALWCHTLVQAAAHTVNVNSVVSARPLYAEIEREGQVRVSEERMKRG